MKKKFKCEICDRKFNSINYLSSHISKSHKEISPNNYYDKWLKSPYDDKCEICSNITKFYSIGKGYLKCCSKECVKISRKRGIYSKYGVENPGQLNWVKSKIIKTNLRKWGVKCVFESEIIKKTIRKTNLRKFGVENPNHNPEIRDKIEKTCLFKYGVKFPLQNTEIFLKGLDNCKFSKKFKNTKIYYRSSYEKDFLEKFYMDYPLLKNGPRIKYISEGNNHYYFPDFFIKSLNLIVEIKSSYLNKRDSHIIALKKEATISKGFNYIIIIDKDYSEFKSIYFK